MAGAWCSASSYCNCTPEDPCGAGDRHVNTRPVILGHLVHYVMPDGETIRAAMIVRAWNAYSLNLEVHYDGTNDSRKRFGRQDNYTRGYPSTEWIQCVTYDAGAMEDVLMDEEHLVTRREHRYAPSTWHWPPRC